jgi:nucleoside-diphosphate-sugar epimerase
VLIVGGTGFIGAPLARTLIELGHSVTVFHRGQHEPALPAPVRHVRSPLAGVPVRSFPPELIAGAPDAVVHLLLVNASDAAAALTAFRGSAGRLVVVSSGDVYAAYGALRGLEPAPALKGPLTEDAPLRGSRYPYGRRVAQSPWGVPLEDYDKILVEQAAQAASDLPAVIVRLPMVYGPGDGQHRFRSWLARMEHRRPAILLGSAQASYRLSHGYVENIAHALALAATHPTAPGRVYHTAEPVSLTTAERVRRLGDVVGWQGEVVALPEKRLPAHLRDPYHYTADLAFDTIRIRRELGYVEPVSAHEGLRRTVEWERETGLGDPDVWAPDYAAEDEALTLARSHPPA